jgi:hypothetical protein
MLDAEVKHFSIFFELIKLFWNYHDDFLIDKKSKIVVITYFPIREIMIALHKRRMDFPLLGNKKFNTVFS